VDIADETPITRSIAVQAREAVTEADLVLFVVDAQLGITPGDEEVAQILRESHKPVLVLANKIDDPKHDSLAFELHKLGLGDPVPISALHGHGAGDLLDEIVRYLESHAAAPREELPPEAIRVALVLIDATQGVVEQDLAIADVSRKADCATLVVLSKWDETTVRLEDVRKRLRRRLRQRPTFIAVSAHSGRGLERLLDTVAELF